ncbi:MAG: ribose 5-phosphate isomerase B [Peptostreptococcaceae bacterium]|nr:ribose 5-phosphate isomerase B [Peptostreptococcaceae bacterium]
MIALASDHGGFELKVEIKNKLEKEGYEVVDLGAYTEESVDYPVYGKKCAEEVAAKKAEKGIVICGSGIGISIAANKVKGIRCALCTSVEMAELAAKHNNANMLALGGRLTEKDLAFKIVDKWLNTEFEGGRHERRVKLLDCM